MKEATHKSGIVVKGAREHNLKNIDVFIPRNKITVITGLSGSGKSTLAFDTIYAEGQRRYVESLSAYARNFLEQLKKPAVDSITGLSPAIAIEQKTTSTNPRSTVGTVTEAYDFLRLLYAKVGQPVCPTHRIPLLGQRIVDIVSDICRLPDQSKLLILSPVVRTKKGEFQKEIEKWLKLGFVRARVDGEFLELQNVGRLAKTKTHNIDIVIDRVVLKPESESRIKEAVELALRLADGYVTIELSDQTYSKTYSQKLACPQCDFNFPEIEPRLLSFNNPKGACPDCNGVGLLGFGEASDDSDSDDELPEEIDELALKICTGCNGTRLKKEALSILIEGKNIAELSALSIEKALAFVKSVPWNDRQLQIVSKLNKSLVEKLEILSGLGVGYLSLSRSVRTLSGGETQRIRLATQLGSALVGVLYVLDEPSIGLHAKDHAKLLTALKGLRDRGNTIILVEHDEETIMSSDLVIDLGPRAGVLGGDVIAFGTPEELRRSKTSITGQYLNRTKNPSVIRNRKLSKEHPTLNLIGAEGNNLKSVDISIPLGTLISVTGVSGSGKSTLIIDTLYRILANHFNKTSYVIPPFQSISGVEHLKGIVEINQKPIGRTPRSNPATYVGLFTLIRELFSKLPESRMRGYLPGRFSFNVKGGRCEACQGAGQIRMEMHFLAQVYVQCDVCAGKRYNRETLSVKYREKSIDDVLSMSIAEASEFFASHPKIKIHLETLVRVGLDYLTLGQSSTTLSGGEAQRIKLSKELRRRSAGQYLYILDEPTTGLHFEDVHKLLELLQELVDQGNTVLVIEHNLDVVKSSDYVIDLGPGGGDAGGTVVACGTPNEIKKNRSSVTGPFL